MADEDNKPLFTFYARLPSYNLRADALVNTADVKILKSHKALTSNLIDYGLYSINNTYQETLPDEPSQVDIMPCTAFRTWWSTEGGLLAAHHHISPLRSRYLVVPVLIRPRATGRSNTPAEDHWLIAIIVNVRLLQVNAAPDPLEPSASPALIILDSYTSAGQRAHEPQFYKNLVNFAAAVAHPADPKKITKLEQQTYFPRVRASPHPSKAATLTTLCLLALRPC